ncbi:16870_t:CDS:10 [Gigaspora rosea]|nr:16870_t:CDS:10 [Gigaspora rosea]
MVNRDVSPAISCDRLSWPKRSKFRSFSQAIIYRKKTPPIVKIKKWKQSDVIKYLRSIKNELDLKDKYIDIIEEHFGSRAPQLSTQLKPFSSYTSKDDMKYVLSKYGITDLYKMPRFKPEMVEIKNNDINLQRCLDSIKIMIDNMGDLIGRNEAVHSRYIDTILQNSLHIAKQITKKQISLEPEFEIIGVEASDDVDYAFRMGKINSDSEEFVCITEAKRFTEEIGIIQNIIIMITFMAFLPLVANEWYFIMYTPKKIYLSEKYLIDITLQALNDDTKLRNEVKNVMKIIAGLLKDRVKVDDFFTNKESRIDLLRQESTRLMAENVEFKAKYDEAKDEITKLRAELRNRIEELEKARIDTAVENTRRNVENVRRDAVNAELKARVAKLEEGSRLHSTVANETVPANSKSSEEKIMDSFLNEVNRKRVSDEIRQRKREEKLAKVETEVSEGAVTKVTPDNSIPLVSSQKESDSSTNCSNIIDESGSNSLDVCLEKTVEMGTPAFSLLYEKLCDAVILADRATQEIIFCYCQFGKALIQRRGEIASEKQVDLESNTTQLCEPSSQSDNKNSYLSHITHITSSNAPTESQVPNESAMKKLDTKLTTPYSQWKTWKLWIKNGNQFPYDPELAKLYSQDKLEYCLTCNTSSNKFKFAIVA